MICKNFMKPHLHPICGSWLILLWKHVHAVTGKVEFTSLWLWLWLMILLRYDCDWGWVKVLHRGAQWGRGGLQFTLCTMGFTYKTVLGTGVGRVKGRQWFRWFGWDQGGGGGHLVFDKILMLSWFDKILLIEKFDKILFMMSNLPRWCWY